MSDSQDGSKPSVPTFAASLGERNRLGVEACCSPQAGSVAKPFCRADHDQGGELVAALRDDILACRICRETPKTLPLRHEPRPIFRISSSARLLIASQAPGIRAHVGGIPFRDASGDRLRHWMKLNETDFYDASRVAIVPMGFCFPGHDSNMGDLPPRRECHLAWHDRVFAALPQIETVLAIGLYAIRYHVGRLMPEHGAIGGLTETVADWRSYFDRPRPRILPLPHPSWRNSGWIKRNPWFEAQLIPVLRSEVARLVRAEDCSGPVQRLGLESTDLELRRGTR